MTALGENYENEVYNTKDAIEIVWTLVCTAMIFFMQSGFALVEVGSVRAKNAQSILIKNCFDSAVGCIGFWLVGYAFAFGNVKYFIGFDPKYFAASGFASMPTDNYKWWIFQYSFAATSATIVSGSLAERCQLTTYLFFSFFMTSFIYPVVVSWIWAENTWGIGWLKWLGFIDFAGSGVVHMVGGVCGLWGAKILGERYGKAKLREEQERKRQRKLENINTSRDSVDFDDHEF
jgi:Amt family ammonium transporter